MPKQFKFSIIVPIYNVEKYLKTCLDSVLNQSYSDWELILVDDGSSDNCPKICDEYAYKDTRIQVIHKKNGGLPAARNSGLLVCSGDYILHLDGDDFLADNCLLKINEIVQTSKDLYLGNGRYDFFSDNEITNVAFYQDVEGLKTKRKIIDKYFAPNALMPSAVWHNIYRKDFIQDKKLLFTEGLTWSEDKDYFFNVLFHCESVEIFNYNFYYYRHDNNSAMTKYYTLKNVMSNASVTVKWFYKIDELDKNNSNIIKRRLSEDMIYCIGFLNRMSPEDKRTFIKYLKQHSSVMNYTHTWIYRIIYFLSRIVGFSITAGLWGLIR